VQRLYEDPLFAARVGWSYRDWPMRRVIQGLQHVDDSCIFSKIWCEKCIETGAAKLWPRDVGVQKEGASPNFVYLQALVQVLPEPLPNPFIISPNYPNVDFVRQTSMHPQFSKIPVCISTSRADRQWLGQFVWVKISMFDQVLQGNLVPHVRLPRNMFRELPSHECLANLCVELFLLRWPVAIFSHALARFPRHNRSPFSVLARALGEHLRKASRRHGDTFDYFDAPSFRAYLIDFLWFRSGLSSTDVWHD